MNRILAVMTAITVMVTASSFSSGATIGDDPTDGTGALWDFPATVTGLVATVEVDLDGISSITTNNADDPNNAGVVLNLLSNTGTAGALVDSSGTGPNEGVGETFFGANLLSGSQVIQITVPDYGTYEFVGEWNLSGEQGTEVPFQVEFVPEPTSIALLGLGGLALLRRRRRA